MTGMSRDDKWNRGIYDARDMPFLIARMEAAEATVARVEALPEKWRQDLKEFTAPRGSRKTSQPLPHGTSVLNSKPL